MTKSALSIVMVCGALVACEGKPVTSCIGDGSVDVQKIEMSDVDKYFIQTDFDKFIGSTIGKLEGDFTIKYRERTAITKSSSTLQRIDYTFSNNYSVKVYIAEAKYTKYNEKTNKWDFKRLGNETISGINITHAAAGDFYYCKDYGDIRQ